MNDTQSRTVSALSAACGHPQVRALLARFIDLLNRQPMAERNRPPSEPVPGTLLTDLVSPGRPGDDDLLWHRITSLIEAGVFVARRTGAKTLRSGEAQWARVRLDWVPDAEPAVRTVLGLPVVDPYKNQWQAAVAGCVGCFHDPQWIVQNPLTVTGWSAGDVVQRLMAGGGWPDGGPGGVMGALTRGATTARQIGAALFGGDSKTLDGKEAWLTQAFGLRPGVLDSRPLLARVHLPHDSDGGSSKGILLIENLDTYLQLMDLNRTAGVPGSGGSVESGGGMEHRSWPEVVGWGLLYTEGFTGTCAALADPAQVRWHFSARGQSDTAFDLNRVVGEGRALAWFGDLDWAGLQIFRRLRSHLPSIVPWRPGWEAMWRARAFGVAHTLDDAAKKGDQTPIRQTGDAWLDRIAEKMARDPRFVDQEVAYLWRNGSVGGGEPRV